MSSTLAGGSKEFEKPSMSSMNLTLGISRLAIPSVMDWMERDVCSPSFLSDACLLILFV